MNRAFLALGLALLVFPSSGLAGGSSGSPYIRVVTFADGLNFVNGYSTAGVTVEVRNADGTLVGDGAIVTWAVTRAENNSPAMYSGWGAKKTGLTWGSYPEMVLFDYIPERTDFVTSTTTGGRASVQLTDIVGERNITIKATAHVDGIDRSAEQVVSFGNGPLFIFKSPSASVYRTWQEAYELCNGKEPSGDDDPMKWTSDNKGEYRGGGKLPGLGELQSVSPVDERWPNNPDTGARGAAFAAGWPNILYWSGAARGAESAWVVALRGGYARWRPVGHSRFTVCRR